MKFSKIFIFCFSFYFLLIQILPIVKANPVPASPQTFSFSYIITCIFLFIGTLGCEFVIGYFMIHNTKENKSHFFRVIFSINAVTFPFTQLFVYLFALIILPNFLFYFILVIEIAVIFTEWLLMTLLINKSHIFKDFSEYNTKANLFLYSLIANTITYLMGIGFIFLWGTLSLVYFTF